MNARQLEIFSAESGDLDEATQVLQKNYRNWLKTENPIVISVQTTHQTVVGNPEDPVEYHFMTLTVMYRPRQLRHESESA